MIRRRAPGRLHSGDFGKAEDVDLSVALISVAEVSGQRDYELAVERDTPAELSVKPV